MRSRIAIIGSGAAGLTAAHLLRRRHDVTLFERERRLGGHTNTVSIEHGPDAGTAVDTGFIVLNDRNYPLLHRLLKRLGCSVRWSDMSFSYSSDVARLHFAGTGWNGLFAQRHNLLRPSFHRLLIEIVRFCRHARRDLSEGRIGAASLREYLGSRRVPREAVRHYIVPMAAAIWSASRQQIFDFPAETLLRFWNNHGLLSLEDRPRWQTVVGGSHSYVRAIRSELREVVTDARIASVERTPDAATIRFENGLTRAFDAVVLAAHADESLALLADPTPDERRLLGAWRYARNDTVLHTDASFMPPMRRAWASWNYVEPETGGDEHSPVPVTYWMNRLQGLRTKREYFVTLNPVRPIASGAEIARFDYAHPQYTAEAVATQPELPRLQGMGRTYFCGSYFGYGFHEDAVRSGAAVAKLLGGETLE